MKRVQNRFTAFFLSIMLLIASAVTTINAEGDIYNITSVEDLIRLADNCRMDGWSVDKTIELKQDLDLSDIRKFDGIPSFAGVFHGNYHTIKGYVNNDANGTVGLIRFLESSGKIYDLTVESSIISTDDTAIIGGIVSVNAGLIQNCNYTGRIQSSSVTGGITGENSTIGTVTRCANRGTIVSSKMVGGIAGRNYGVISACNNQGEINTDTSWLGDEESTTDALFKEAKESFLGSDIGGIVGYSSGSIAGCSNMSTVGYPHSGSNVGGIVGRHNGTVTDCTNTGKVLGKQDVGGIAGQFEPEIRISAGEELEDAVDQLHDLIDKTITDMDAMGNAVDTDLEALQNTADSLSDTTDKLTDEARSVIKADIDVLNEIMNRIDYVNGKMPTVLDYSKAALESLRKVNDDLGSVREDLDIGSKMDEEDYDAVKYSRIAIESSEGGYARSNNTNPAEGAEVIITVHSDDGYHLKSLTRTDSGTETDITGQVSDGKYTFTMPENNVLFRAQFEYDGDYVARSNEGGKVSVTTDNDEVIVRVIPNSGYHIDGGQVSVGGTALTVVKVDGQSYYEGRMAKQTTGSTIVVEARFEKDSNSHSITTVTSAGGVISADKLNASSDPAEKVEFTVVANTGYRLDHLEIKPEGTAPVLTGENKYTIDMPDEDVTASAYFVYKTDDAGEPADDAEIYIVSNPGGSAAVTQSIANRNEYLITIRPQDGYELSDSGAVLKLKTASGETVYKSKEDMSINGNVYTCTININNYAVPVRAEAEFTRKTDTVNVTAVSGTGGNVVSDRSKANPGDSIRIAVTNQIHYHLSSLMIGREDHTADVSGGYYDYTIPASQVSDVNITACFDPVNIVVSTNIGGSASYAVEGQEVVLTVTPESGYSVDSIMLKGSDGQEILVQKQYADSYIYRFPVTENLCGDQTGTLDIRFSRQSDRQTVDEAKDRIERNTAAVNDSMTKIEDINQQIEDILTDDFGELRDLGDLSEEEREELENLLLDLADAMTEAGVATGQIGQDLVSIEQIMGPYLSDALDEANKDLEQANKDIDEFIDNMDGAVSTVDSIFTYLNSLGKLQFKNISSEFDKNSDQLKIDLDNISSIVRKLRSTIQTNSDVVEADLRKVNDQLNDIFDLVIERLDNLENVANGESIYHDRSAEDPDDPDATRMVNCVNEGSVQGNSNIGGIAGSLGVDFSTGNDTEVKITTLIDTRAVMTGCKNHGFVTAKNDYSGGVIGNMEVGYLERCLGDGSARSESGNYVGGIAGISGGTINSCYSLSEVSGNSYLGGIAGTGNIISDCYSMAYISDGEGRTGAIAGSDESEDEEISVRRLTIKERIHGNYYVSKVLYGIDGISYMGVAEPLSYDELTSIDSIPSEFRNLKVIFADEDDHIISKQTVKYGESLLNLQYPQVESEADSYNEWYGMDHQVMEGNLILRVASADTVTILASQEKTRGKSMALASGNFTENARLIVADSDVKRPVETEGKSVSIHYMSFENTSLNDSSLTTVRVFNENGGINGIVYVLEDGQWQEVNASESGQYYEFIAKGTSCTYCLATVQKHTSGIIFAVIGVILALLAGGIVCFVHKRKKHNKKVHKKFVIRQSEEIQPTEDEQTPEMNESE